MKHLKAVASHWLVLWGLHLMEPSPERGEMIEWFLIYLEERQEELLRENPELARYL